MDNTSVVDILDLYTDPRFINFNSGYWNALDDILMWINTLDELSISKTDLYAHVMEMRPKND